jgi:hypothetical protein
MVKIFRMFFLAAAFMFVAQASAFAGAQDFAFVNNTSLAVHNIYCSSANSDNWEEDVLGESGVVMPGETITIRFNAAQRGQYWDLRVVFENGTDIYWEDIDLLKVSVITVNNDGTANFN